MGSAQKKGAWRCVVVWLHVAGVLLFCTQPCQSVRDQELDIQLGFRGSGGSSGQDDGTRELLATKCGTSAVAHLVYAGLGILNEGKSEDGADPCVVQRHSLLPQWSGLDWKSLPKVSNPFHYRQMTLRKFRQEFHNAEASTEGVPTEEDDNRVGIWGIVDPRALKLSDFTNMLGSSEGIMSSLPKLPKDWFSPVVERVKSLGLWPWHNDSNAQKEEPTESVAKVLAGGVQSVILAAASAVGVRADQAPRDNAPSIGILPRNGLLSHGPARAGRSLLRSHLDYTSDNMGDDEAASPLPDLHYQTRAGRDLKQFPLMGVPWPRPLLDAVMGPAAPAPEVRPSPAPGKDSTLSNATHHEAAKAAEKVIRAVAPAVAAGLSGKKVVATWPGAPVKPTSGTSGTKPPQVGAFSIPSPGASIPGPPPPGAPMPVTPTTGGQSLNINPIYVPVPPPGATSPTVQSFSTAPGQGTPPSVPSSFTLTSTGEAGGVKVITNTPVNLENKINIIQPHTETEISTTSGGVLEPAMKALGVAALARKPRIVVVPVILGRRMLGTPA